MKGVEGEMETDSRYCAPVPSVQDWWKDLYSPLEARDDGIRHMVFVAQWMGAAQEVALHGPRHEWPGETTGGLGTPPPSGPEVEAVEAAGFWSLSSRMAVGTGFARLGAGGWGHIRGLVIVLSAEKIWEKVAKNGSEDRREEVHWQRK